MTSITQLARDLAPDRPVCMYDGEPVADDHDPADCRDLIATERAIDALLSEFEREHGPIGSWITYLDGGAS